MFGSMPLRQPHRPPVRPHLTRRDSAANCVFSFRAGTEFALTGHPAAGRAGQGRVQHRNEGRYTGDRETGRQG